MISVRLEQMLGLRIDFQPYRKQNKWTNCVLTGLGEIKCSSGLVNTENDIEMRYLKKFYAFRR